MIMDDQLSTFNCETYDASEIYKNGTYLMNNQTWHIEDSPWKAKQINNILKKNNIVPNDVCEVGCGAGEIIKQLSAIYQNTNFIGYELSPDAYEFCKKRETNRVKYLLKNILKENIYVDCLLCIDVFEHVEDYMGFIKNLKSKSTYKVFHIPLDISVLGILRSLMLAARQSIGHLHYFTRDTALATLKDCGYEIVDSFYTTSFLDLPRKSLKAKIAKLPRQILFSISPHWAVKILGGCSLIVLAK